MRYIMALDQGTTSSRCILFDRHGSIAGMVQREFRQIYPQPGWVEQDPMEIWGSQIGVAAEAMASHGLSASDIQAIGLANQRETVVVWERESGRPIHNAIVWQCRRTAERCRRLRDDGHETEIRRRTGLTLDPYFSASKLEWILDAVPGSRSRAKDGELLFGTVDSWLLWNLTRGRIHATDYTNASRTMLFNIHDGCWDDSLLELFSIPKAMLPEVHPSRYLYGAADKDVLGGEIPVAGVAGDQQAALFGQLCCREGQAKNTYGTGCFLLMNTGTDAVESRSGLLTTVAASPGGALHYALEGSIFTGGSVVQWLRDEMGLIDHAADSEAEAVAVPDTAGVYIVPAFAGMGAPYWNPRARGTITGITRSAGKRHLIRAALESMAYQTLDVLRAMEADSGNPLEQLKVDGGAAANSFLMQFQADILDRTVIRPRQVETTALGAAFLAGLETGFWRDTEELAAICGGSSVFSPAMSSQRRESYIAGWRRAQSAAFSWAGEE